MKRVALAVLVILLLAGGCCFRLEAGQCGPAIPTLPPIQPTPTPTASLPTPTPVPTPSDKPACWDSRLDQLGVTVLRRDGAYELVAAWLTINGSWDDVPACAKELVGNWNNLGGDHHAYGRVESLGQAGWAPVMETFALVWPGGGDTRQPEPNGWANIPLGGQNWNPSNGPGPYHWFPFGGDKLIGLGLPFNHHYSFFGLWRIKLARINSFLMGR